MILGILGKKGKKRLKDKSSNEIFQRTNGVVAGQKYVPKRIAVTSL